MFGGGPIEMQSPRDQPSKPGMANLFGDPIPQKMVEDFGDVEEPQPRKEKDSLLLCNICVNKYDTASRLPLSLHCGHSLCRECAKTMFKQNRIKCPFDNSSFNYSSFEALGRNFTVLELLDQEKQRLAQSDVRHCAIHKNKKAKFFCTVDEAYACSECLLGEHSGHQVSPARPLILGGIVRDSVEQAAKSIATLAEIEATMIAEMEKTNANEIHDIETMTQAIVTKML